MSMQWKVLSLILRARANMRVLLSKVYKSKEKMKLYCFLFPSDYEFDRETLIQLWMAMGFSEQRCAENFCKRYFDALVKEEYISFSRVEILSGKTMYKVDQRKVKLLSDGTTHTIMEIIDDIYTFLEYDESNSVGSKKSCHVSLVSNDINQVSFKELNYGGLRTLLFLRNYGSSLKQIPPYMFFTLELVQALDLSGSHIIELPISIRNLRHLRYLDLSFTLIECLPESIDRLCQLQTLKLQGCRHLYELPKGMKELIRLHHLEFDVLGQLTFLPKGIGALTEIRTLSAFIVDSKQGCNITELKGMNKLRGRCCISGLEHVSSSDAREAFLQGKEHLTHLQLRWNNLKLYSSKDQHEAYNIIANLELNKGLEELQITCYPAMELPAWVNFQDLVNLVRITLFKCENISVALPLGKFPNLKGLTIAHMNRVTKIDRLVRGGDEVYAAFPRLERLEIVCMSSIESWVDVYLGDFPLLSKLIIKQCPKLNSLAFIPQLNSLEHLEISHCAAFECLPDGALRTNLKTFIVHDCPTLEMNCSQKGKDWDKIKHAQEIWIDYENISCFHEDMVDGGDKRKKSSTSEDIIYSTPLADGGDSSTADNVQTQIDDVKINNMTIPKHHHPLLLEDSGKPYDCDGCKMFGTGRRYRCKLCDFDLHPNCMFPASTITTVHGTKGRKCHFYEKPLECTMFRCTHTACRSCDACGRDIKGFNYHCPTTGEDFHPSCLNLEGKIIIEGAIFSLLMKGPSRCAWCKRKLLKGADKNIGGWSYVSPDGVYNFHVFCLMQMVKQSYYSLTSDERCSSISISSYHSTDFPGDQQAIPHKLMLKPSSKTSSKSTKILTTFLGYVFSILLGDGTPNVITSNMVPLLLDY